MDALRSIAVALVPFLPETAQKMLDQLHIDQGNYTDLSLLDRYPAGQVVEKGPVLFPRLDPEEAVQRIHAENNQLIASRQGISLEELEARQRAHEAGKEEA